MKAIEGLREMLNTSPQVLQKYMEGLSRLSQLAHGGFSVLASSISCRINKSDGGIDKLSFN